MAPLSSRVLQLPQLPVRQPKAGSRPHASASSSNEPDPGVHRDSVADSRNITGTGPAAGAGRAGAGDAGVPGASGVRTSDAGPNASAWMRESATPLPRSPLYRACTNGGGPQRNQSQS